MPLPLWLASVCALILFLVYPLAVSGDRIFFCQSIHPAAPVLVVVGFAVILTTEKHLSGHRGMQLIEGLGESVLFRFFFSGLASVLSIVHFMFIASDVQFTASDEHKVDGQFFVHYNFRGWRPQPLESCSDEQASSDLVTGILICISIVVILIRFTAARNDFSTYDAEGVVDLIAYSSLTYALSEYWRDNLYSIFLFFGAARFLQCAFLTFDFRDQLQSFIVRVEPESLNSKQSWRLFLAKWLLDLLLVSKVILCICSAAAVIFAAELPCPLLQPDGSSAHPANCNSEMARFRSAIYFTFVTMSTVGFGDMVAHTVLGRVVTLLMLVAVAGVFPVWMDDISDVIAGRYKGGDHEEATKQTGSTLQTELGALQAKINELLPGQLVANKNDSHRRLNNLHIQTTELQTRLQFTHTQQLNKLRATFRDARSQLNGEYETAVGRQRNHQVNASQFFLVILPRF